MEVNVTYRDMTMTATERADHMNRMIQSYTLEIISQPIPGKEYIETWQNEFKHKHRDGAPARIWHYADGSPYKEEWYHIDHLHRLDGPAVLWYDEQGMLTHGKFFVHGEHLNVTEWSGHTSLSLDEQVAFKLKYT